MRKRLKLINLIFIFLGYLFGLFLTSIVAGKIPFLKDNTIIWGVLGALFGVFMAYVSYKLSEGM